MYPRIYGGTRVDLLAASALPWCSYEWGWPYAASTCTDDFGMSRRVTLPLTVVIRASVAKSPGRARALSLSRLCQ
jgi:hypothetical protein